MKRKWNVEKVYLLTCTNCDDESVPMLTEFTAIQEARRDGWKLKNGETFCKGCVDNLDE